MRQPNQYLSAVFTAMVVTVIFFTSHGVPAALITSIVAIALFVLRELSDTKKQEQLEQRKGDAMRLLLADQCRSSRYAMIDLNQMFLHVGQDGRSENSNGVYYRIRKLPSNNVYVDRVDYINSKVRYRTIRHFQSTLLDKLLLDAAQYDKDLYLNLKAAYEAIQILQYVRERAVQYLENNRAFNETAFQIVDAEFRQKGTAAYSAITKAYQFCTGNELPDIQSRDRFSFDQREYDPVQDT